MPIFVKLFFSLPPGCVDGSTSTDDCCAMGGAGGDCCSLRLPDDSLFLGLDCSTQ